MTLVLSLLLGHRPQNQASAGFCAATSIFFRLYLFPDVHIYFSRSLLFLVFFGRPFPACWKMCQQANLWSVKSYSVDLSICGLVKSLTAHF